MHRFHRAASKVDILYTCFLNLSPRWLCCLMTFFATRFFIASSLGGYCVLSSALHPNREIPKVKQKNVEQKEK